MVLSIILWCVVGIIVLVLYFGTFFTIPEQSKGLIERFGEYVREAGPGLNVKIPIHERVHVISLQTREMVFEIVAKTKDNAFVNVQMALQYSVIHQAAKDAYYKLEDPAEQIESYLRDAMLKQVTKNTLPELFEQKDNIAKTVNDKLSLAMTKYGYNIIDLLITDIEPDEMVKSAMNNACAAAINRAAAMAAEESA